MPLFCIEKMLFPHLITVRSLTIVGALGRSTIQVLFDVGGLGGVS